jgi:uncharacterized cupin superfamily protein
VSEGAAGVNLFGDEWTGGREREGWRWRHMQVGKALGAERIGASLYELAPGQRTFPYHWHTVKEEWLVVLHGEPMLRDPSGERRLAAGDVVLFRRGPEGAHAVRNDTDEPVRLLMLSSDQDTRGEIAFYPDSGKVGLWGAGISKMLDENAELDYFHGEE